MPFDRQDQDAKRRCTPSWRIRLKARVDLGDQTAEFIPFGVISTAILAYFTLFWVQIYAYFSVINTRFQPCICGSQQ